MAAADTDSEYKNGHSVLVDCHVKVVQGLSREPKALADNLHSKGFLSDEKFEEMVQLPATSTDNARKLYTSIIGVVEHYPQSYREFILVLQENPLLYGDLLRTLNESSNKQGELDHIIVHFKLPFVYVYVLLHQ